MDIKALFCTLVIFSAAHAETETWCDPVLGCLELTDDWYSATRPINTLPASREKINTRFYLHTQAAPSYYEDVQISAEDLTTIASSTFDASKPIKVITHGFMDSGFKNWMYDLANDLISYGDFNVIRTDWKGGSQTGYSHACANTRVVGLEIGYLINTLIDTYQVDPANVHLIGHSLGSHISGYAGEQITNLGRITGLDPAGPFFTDTATFIRLDDTDAVFVDNIHTDAGVLVFGFGTGQNMGHLDFYPNSGESQPGCDPWDITMGTITGDLENGLRDVVACNHGRAINFFMETLKGASCPWVAHECVDYNSYNMGQCSSCGDDDSKCAYMGIRADEYVSPTRTGVQMYLNTNDASPFCKIHYGIKILTAYPKGASDWVMGNIRVTFYGSNGGIILEEMITDKHERINHGTTLSFLMTTSQEIGDILRVELLWNYDDTINPGTYCWALLCNKALYVQSVEVTPASEIPQSTVSEKTILGCSVDGSTTEIKDGNVESFLDSTVCTQIA